MTTPGLSGASSEQSAPHQQKTKKQLNVVALIALITAVLGFIFACMPGALIVGWVLLPIAFILAVVSLFVRDKPKGMGIAALIVSVVGTIVGFVVFFAVVGSSFDNAFGSGDTTVAPPSSAAGSNSEASGNDAGAEAGTRENPSPLGSVIESDDWRVVINSVTLAATDTVIAANSFNDPPTEGSEYILVNYSVTYIGDDPNGESPISVSVDYVTADGRTITSHDKSVVEPDAIKSNTLYTGGTATGNTAFEVPSATAGQGVIAVRAGMLGDTVFVAAQ